MKNIIVIYHKNCMDGTASAWVAYEKYGETAQYIACDDRVNLPEYVTAHKILSGVEVYVIDFCYPKDVLLDLQTKVKKLVVLDHHVTAKDAIESVEHYVYGVEKSGAMLAWEYFFPSLPVPLAIQYVSDSDTWTHKMPNYEYVNSYIYKTDSTFDMKSFSDLVAELEDATKFTKIQEIGKVLREVHMSAVNSYVNKAELISFLGYQVYVVNAPSEIKSELGRALAEKTNSFGVVYYFYDKNWRFSLRSVPDFDASAVAKSVGGGGHKNAAAFVVPADNPVLSILENLKLFPGKS